MQGHAIIKIEADAAAAQEDILQHFNAYLQQSSKAPSFIEQSAGYFRISYDDASGISSAAIARFGSFLQSSGYFINGLAAAATADGQQGTTVSFTNNNGKEAHVLLSTLRVY